MVPWTAKSINDNKRAKNNGIGIGINKTFPLNINGAIMHRTQVWKIKIVKNFYKLKTWQKFQKMYKYWS